VSDLHACSGFRGNKKVEKHCPRKSGYGPAKCRRSQKRLLFGVNNICH